MISNQTVVTDKDILLTNSEKLDKLLMVYRNSGVRFSSKTITISESQIKELIESLNDLQIKYNAVPLAFGLMPCCRFASGSI